MYPGIVVIIVAGELVAYESEMEGPVSGEMIASSQERNNGEGRVWILSLLMAP